MTYARVAAASALAFTLVLPDVALARRSETEPPGAATATAATPPPSAPVSTSVAAPATVAPAPATAPAPGWDPAATTTTTTIVTTPPPPVATPASLPAPRPAPVPPPRLQGGKEMVIAGGVTFGLVYFFTSLGGAVTIDKTRDRQRDSITGRLEAVDRRRLNYGRGLLVPVVGPFISMAYTDSATQRWGAALSGSIQAAGAVLVLAGMVRNARARRWERMSFGAGSVGGGATVSISGRF